MTGILLGFATLAAVLIALVVQRRWRRIRGVAGGLLVSYVTVVLILGVGEIYFRYVFAQSENTLTLATVNWLDRYWVTNSLGYRDREWTEPDWADKTTIMVTGDSFTAGWGLENPADRYTDVLASQLGDDYAVLNLGVYGTATVEHLENLREHPLQNPDVVILQYFLNDINYTMLRLGVLPEASPTPAWARESYLGNWLYTRLIGRMLDPDYNRDWWEDNYAAYDNATIWDLHRQEIESYIDYVESIDARLIVVIFPNMLDPVRSVAYVDRVADVFTSRGHDEILKLFDEAAAWTLEDRIVSPRDTHPSAAFHQMVGDTLFQAYFSP